MKYFIFITVSIIIASSCIAARKPISGDTASTLQKTQGEVVQDSLLLHYKIYQDRISKGKRPLGEVAVPLYTECGSTPTDACIVTQNTTFEPGTYYLPNGIFIVANDITLDCNGAVLIGSSTISAAGIYIGQNLELGEPVSGAIVTGCTVDGYDKDVNSAGIWLTSGATNNIIEHNTVLSNRHGIRLDTQANNNLIKNNTIKSNNGDGIRSQGVSGNEIYNNNIMYNVVQASETGTNSWDGGDYIIGGNYWKNYPSDPPCIDDQEPYGICDVPYILGSITDNYPFVNQDGWLLNRPPILDSIGNREVNENELLTIQLSAVDPNVDSLTYLTDAGSVLPSSFIFNCITGLFEWTPTYDDSGAYSVLFMVTDGTLADLEQIQITVLNVNRAPVLDSIGPNTVEADSNLTFDITASDPDGDIPSLDAEGLPAGATFTDSLDGSGTFDWTPVLADTGIHYVTFIASDSTLSDSEEVEITVVPPGCCIGIRGNVDGDAGESINVADPTYLVDFLFFGGPAPPCFEEGDVDGSGTINVADPTYLVDYLFFAGPAPPSCP